MTIREAAQAYLDAQEAEALAQRAYENAKANYSDHRPYGAAYEATMLVTCRALEALRAELAKDVTVEIPRVTLASILRDWETAKARYEKVGSEWHYKQPAHWEWHIVMRAGEVRDIARLAAREGK